MLLLWNFKLWKSEIDRYWKIDKPTIVIGDFNTLLSILDRKGRKIIFKDIEDMYNSIWPDWYWWDTTSNNCRIHILFKCE